MAVEANPGSLENPKLALSERFEALKLRLQAGKFDEQRDEIDRRLSAALHDAGRSALGRGHGL